VREDKVKQKKKRRLKYGTTKNFKQPDSQGPEKNANCLKIGESTSNEEFGTSGRHGLITQEEGLIEAAAGGK